MRSFNSPVFGLRRRSFAAGRAGFSLVEVVIAIGIVSFSLFALMGTLPEGIKTVQITIQDSARANITQEIRAELQQLSFGSSSGGVSSLSSQVNYYTDRGILLPNSSGAYYSASFATANVPIPGSTSFFQSGNAQTIKVTLSYPLAAPAQNRSTAMLYLLAAKQKSY